MCIGGNSDGPEKPPKYMLFESKQFPNYFITWSLSTDMPDNAVDSTCANNVVKCEVRTKTIMVCSTDSSHYHISSLLMLDCG